MHRTLLALLLLLNFQNTHGADFATQMMEATFKFQNGDSAATCFLIRREAPDTTVYLVTAGHALKDTKNQTATLVLRKLQPDGSYERLNFPLSLRRDDQPRWVCHEKHDLAVLPITDPPPQALAASLPVAMLADEARLKASGVHICSPLFVFAFPWGLEGDASGLPVARQGIFASPPLLPRATHQTFGIDYQAFQGDSGGPAFIAGADGHPLIVGIVTDQHYYEEHTVLLPLHIVDVVHAQYVRDTIEAAAKARVPAVK